MSKEAHSHGARGGIGHLFSRRRQPSSLQQPEPMPPMFPAIGAAVFSSTMRLTADEWKMLAEVVEKLVVEARRGYVPERS